MNELALFAGAGGGVLGGKILGWRTVCAVERDPFAAGILVARQNDGSLEPFPIWDDVETFDGRQWRGCVDVVSGGFPCQPFSTASRWRAVAQDRWPDMLRVVREVEPSWVFAENVQHKPIAQAASDLRRAGYSTAIDCFCTSAFGALHRRPRWWVVAYADGKGESRFAVHAQMASLHPMAGLNLWANHPEGMGVDDGLARRMDRLRCLGNGQVPIVAAAAFATLAARFE